MVARYNFGGDTGETPETLARKRRVAQALLDEAIGGTPRNVGEGLAAIGKALSARFAMNYVNEQEAAGRESGASTFGSIAGLMGGKGQPFPPAPGVSTVAAAMSGNSSQKAEDPNLPSRLDFRRADVAGDFSPQQRALIDTIYGPESRGKYNVMYGGGTFDDMSDHPRQYHRITSGPNAGKMSSAAGAGQFLASTWDDQAKKLGLKDFSAQSQDKATWNLARESYQNATGGNLDEALASGDPKIIASVGRALAPVWTSLPGGIEQGIGSNAFVSAYNSNLGGGGRPPAVAAVNNLATGRPVQVASLDPSAGMPAADPYGLIPATDTRGEDQRAKFSAWNSDPIANNSANMAGIDPALQRVVQRAKEIAGTDFVIGSGRRDAGQQKQAIQNGWSGTMNSDHLGGGAADLWPLTNGQVDFDPAKQQSIVSAMKQAAGELGVDLEAGADWRKADVPHFGMIGQTPLDNAPIPTQRPDQPVQVASLDPSLGMAQRAQSTAAANAASMPPAPALPDPRTIQDRPIASAPQLAQAGPDLSRLPVTAGGNGGVYTPGQGPTLPQLYQALQNPWLNETQRAIIGGEVDRLQQEADPLRQLQLDKLRREIATPQKDWTRLDDHTLFRPSTGETKRVDGGKPNLFEGTSLDAQAWNILQNTDPSSREYATAYSIVAQPKQQLVQTADGLVPVLVPPQLPSWLKAPGGSPEAPTGPGAPQGNAALPQSAPQGNAVAGSAIPGTIKPTETQRNRVSNVNQAFETINGELDRYADLVKKNGIEIMPGEGKDNLNTVRQGIMLQMKELFNLGVLNGPDLSLMERMIYDPVVDVTKEGGVVNLIPQLWTGATGGAEERARNSVAELKRMLGNIKESAAQSIAAPGQQQAAPPPPGGIVDYRTYFGGGQ